MPMITVWKKALRCLSVAEWRWCFCIVEMQCEEEEMIRFEDGGKCRVPQVRVVGIIDMDGWPKSAAAAGTDAANLRASDLMALGDRVALDARTESDYGMAAWYGRHNFTGLSDGSVVSWYDHTRWAVGEVVRPHAWDPRRDVRCSSGIHVFLTREEAEVYML